MAGETYLKRKVQAAITERYGKRAFFFKVHGSEYMMAGLPDLVVCLDGRFIGLELKEPGQKPTPRQLYVQSEIRKAGGICEVVYSVREAMSVLESSYS